jgi:hypothetical protein
LSVKQRKSTDDTPVITINTNVPFELTVMWGKEKKKTIAVKPGSHTY